SPMWRYPKWQFDSDFRVLPDVLRILRLLKTRDTVHVLKTLLVPAAGNGRPAIEAYAHAMSTGVPTENPLTELIILRQQFSSIKIGITDKAVLSCLADNFTLSLLPI